MRARPFERLQVGNIRWLGRGGPVRRDSPSVWPRDMVITLPTFSLMTVGGVWKHTTEPSCI